MVHALHQNGFYINPTLFLDTAVKPQYDGAGVVGGTDMTIGRCWCGEWYRYGDWAVLVWRMVLIISNYLNDYQNWIKIGKISF